MKSIAETTPQNAASAVLAVAESYRARGWPVFPCRAQDEEAIDWKTGEVITLGAKSPLIENGLSGATTREHIVKAWWGRKFPGAMIGIPTGRAIGAFVLDVDVPPKHDDGRIWIAEMEAKHGPLPATLSATTASGGRHLFFTHVDGIRNKAGVSGIAAGIDLRAEGGFIVGAGSVMADGRAYTWDNDNEIADAPEWLLELCRPKPVPERTATYEPAEFNDGYVNAAVDAELSTLAAIPMGSGRNSGLYLSAFKLGTLAGAGAIAEAEVRSALQGVARQWGRDWKKCVTTIDNGLRDGMASPRDMPERTFASDDSTPLRPVAVVIQRGLAKMAPPAAANDNAEDAEPAYAPIPAAKGLPEAMCYPPGAVGEFARYVTSCSRFPSPHLSLVASLAFVAALVGRRYKGPTGLRTNLYVVGLAESGFGKDVTIRATAALADSTPAGGALSAALFADDIRSLPGLSGKLRKAPSCVAVIDEFGKFLQQHTGPKVASHREEIATALMQLTGATAGFWGGQEKGAGNIARIVQPCFSIHGVSTPSTFWNALSSGNISEGLLGRLVIIDAGNGEPVKVKKPSGSLDDVPSHLADLVTSLMGGYSATFKGGPFSVLSANSEEKPYPFMTAEFAPGVDDIFEDFDDAIRARRNSISPEYRPILNRVGENAGRLALIVAIGCDPKAPVITREIQEWANAVAENSFNTILRGADENIADNEQAADYLRVRGIIERRGEDGITKRDLSKSVRGRFRPRELDDIIRMLLQAGDVVFAEATTVSQKRKRYWASQHTPANAVAVSA